MEEKVYSPIIWIAHERHISGANLSLLEFMHELRNAGAKQLLIVNLPGTMKTRSESMGFEVRLIKSNTWTRGLNEPFFNNGFIKRQLRNCIAFFQFIRLFLFYKPELVVSFTSTTYIGALASKVLGIRHYHRISEFGLKDFGFRFSWGNWAYSFMNITSNKILVNSKAVYDQYAFYIIPSKLVLVYNPVHIERSFHKEKSVIDKSAPNLLLMGQVTPSKGHEDALKALHYLREKGIFAKLKIVGSQNNHAYTRALIKMINEYGIDEQVVFQDFQNNRESLLDSSDVLLMCSPNEAFGRVTVEAMKCKLPVIGANAGGTSELIIDHHTGLLYEPGNYADLANKIAIYCTGKIDLLNVTKNAYNHADKLTESSQILKNFYKDSSCSKKKPLILWQAHESELTGANIAMLEYIKAMKQDYRFCVVVPFGGKFSLALVEENIRVVKVMQYNWAMNVDIIHFATLIKIFLRNVTALFNLMMLILRMKPLMVFTNTIIPCNAAFAAWIMRRKHVWWVHEFGAEDFDITIGWGRNERGYKWMQRTSSLVVCNSKAVATKYKVCLPDTRVEFIYQPVSWFKTAFKPFKKQAKLLMFGQLAPTKGHIDVLEALVIAKKKCPDKKINLHIVGPSEDKQYLNLLYKKIEQLQLQDIVKIKEGYFDKTQIMPSYEALIVASYSEAFGRVIIEAKKAGLGIIARNTGGAPELLSKPQDHLFGSVEDLGGILSCFTRQSHNDSTLPYDEADEILKLKNLLQSII